jgi:hypothetical protein
MISDWKTKKKKARISIKPSGTRMIGIINFHGFNCLCENIIGVWSDMQATNCIRSYLGGQDGVDHVEFLGTVKINKNEICSL